MQAVGHPTLEGSALICRMLEGLMVKALLLGANDAVPAAAPEDAEGVEAGEMARVLQTLGHPEERHITKLR